MVRNDWLITSYIIYIIIIDKKTVIDKCIMIDHK